MSFASSNQTAVRFVKETVFGTTPTTPTLQDLRYTAEALNYNLSNIVSEEVRGDRQRSDLIQVQSDASGDITAELSYDSYDDFVQSAFASAWGTAVGVTAQVTIDAANADNSFNDSGSGFGNIVIGQWVKTSGFTDPANNGFFKVVTATSAKITVAGGTLVTEAAGASVTVSGEMLRNGTTLSSYTIQKHFQDATTPVFINFTGARIGSMGLSFSTGEIVETTFGVMALGAASSTTQIAGASINPATTTGVLNAVGNVSTIWLDNAVSSSFFNSLTATIANNLRAQDAVGSLPHVGIALGSLDVTGDISLYFEDDTMYSKFIAATAFALSFLLEDVAGNAYLFTLPRVKFETGEVVSSGLDTDVLLDTTWRGILDPTTSCTVQVDKF